MAGLTVQNFLSAATGIAVAFALIRAFCAAVLCRPRQCVGGSDPHHAVAAAAALRDYCAVLYFAGRDSRTSADYQTIITGRRAAGAADGTGGYSREAIKLLGTSGGGFFGANSAHPFENPTALTNFVQMLAIFLIPRHSVLHSGAVPVIRAGAVRC